MHGRAPLPSQPFAPGLKVGLLGGSFNPAHEGHRWISLVALRRLGLHQVWWLVSPQNPLKPKSGMAPLAARMASARAVADHPAIVISDLEARLGSRYTIDTLHALRRRAPATHFVFLMGADNFIALPRWRDWTGIMESVPIAVIARPGYSLKARLSQPARHYAHRQLAQTDARLLAQTPPPAWVFLEDRPTPISSTAIRAGRKG